jgi:hypothetical protein
MDRHDVDLEVAVVVRGRRPEPLGQQVVARTLEDERERCAGDIAGGRPPLQLDPCQTEVAVR